MRNVVLWGHRKLLPQGDLEGILPTDLSGALGLLTAPCRLVLGDTTADAAPNDSGEPATLQRAAGEVEDDLDLPTNKQTVNQRLSQEKEPEGRNEVTGRKSEGIEQSGIIWHAEQDQDQYVSDARAAAVARLAALAAAKQVHDDGHREDDVAQTNDVEAPAVATVDLKHPSMPTVVLSFDDHEDGVGVVETAEQQAHLGVNGDGSVPNRAGPTADYQEQFTIVRDRGEPVAFQRPPAQYNRVAAAKAKKAATSASSPPSPTPRILDEDEEDVEDGYWDPALTELLGQHRLTRLAPGLRALGESQTDLLSLPAGLTPLTWPALC